MEKHDMTSATPWLGTKRVAFVPLFRSNAAPPDQIPLDWENVILNRVINDPRPEVNGADRSLKAWLRAVSWGRADIEPEILPMQTINRQDVLPGDLDGLPWNGETLGSHLRNNGFDAAVLVMLGGRGAFANAGFWSRVAMSETTGMWLMEIIHSITRFVDLYHFNNDVDPLERAIDSFDEMSASSGTHPTAFTKNELGWLDERNIARYHLGSSSGNGVILNFISFSDQPHITGFTHAVRIGDGFPYVIVEARKKTDQFESGLPIDDPFERGISSEGVIAYRVQIRDATNNLREENKKPLYLLTLTALRPGESALLDDGVTLTVTAETPKAFVVRLFENPPPPPPPPTVPDVVGLNATKAKQEIKDAGLVPVFSGSGPFVVSQLPQGGSILIAGSEVRLKMGTIIP